MSSSQSSKRVLAAIVAAVSISAGLQAADRQPAEAAARGCAATAVNRARAERQFVAKVNASRVARDKHGLRRVVRINRVARRWSRQMSAANRLHHNDDYARQLSSLPWRRASENVGYRQSSGESCGALVRHLHQALMRSPGHRANILGSYNRIGVGVKLDRDGTMWVTQNFALVRR